MSSSTKLIRKSTFQLKNNPVQSTFVVKEESPINLIEYKREKLIINEEALKILKEIKENIIIVTIFGKERTGKSYLMNLLLNQEENSKINKGFKVSSLANNTGRGLWLWNTPISKPNSNNKILFIDSEEIISENVYEQISGAKLLLLILLISSYFIYNTLGDIHSNSLNDLELLIHLDDSIGINENINKDKLIAEICPKFIWAMRDFDLDKLSEDGKDLTSDDYMEQCLKEKFDGINKDEINMIKEKFIKYFKQRECVTFPKPIQEEKDLIYLKKMQLDELDDDFKKELTKLKNKIYKFSKEKYINGKPLDGPMAAFLINEIVKEINNENVLDINEKFKKMILLDIDNCYNQAKTYYKEKIEKLKKEEYDLDIKEIYSIKYEALKEYMNILEKYSIITKNDVYLNEYNTKKEKLDKEIESEINKELSTLLVDNSDDHMNIFIDKDKDSSKEYKKPAEIIEDYLNDLCELKINSENVILNAKDIDNFIDDDIEKTKNIISSIREKDDDGQCSEKIRDLDDEEEQSKDYDTLKVELENTEKYALELVGKITKLMETKNSLKPPPVSVRHSLKSFSSKLVYNYKKGEKICEISSEENPPEKCNCKLDSFKKCNIY